MLTFNSDFFLFAGREDAYRLPSQPVGFFQYPEENYLDSDEIPNE